MDGLTETLSLLVTLGSGLTAGLCFAFASFVMTGFDRLGSEGAIRAMQAINAAILRSVAMVVWFGTAVLAVVVAVLATEQRGVVIPAAALYVVGAILITGLGNVPRNEALDEVDPSGPDADAEWQRYRLVWGRWNLVRTGVLVLATVGFAWGR